MGGMSISLAQPVTVRCGRCGSSETKLIWIAIDLVERPDLRTLIGSGEWTQTVCGICGAVVGRPSPLLVTRLDESAPLLLGVALANGNRDEVAEHHALLETVRARLGDKLVEVPGPLLVVPYEVVVLAARRNVGAD